MPAVHVGEAGTIFQDTRQPLADWFWAMYWLSSQKNGVSALGLQRVLGLGSCKTAWAWLHKFRRAMVRPGRDRLTGRVEVGAHRIASLPKGWILSPHQGAVSHEHLEYFLTNSRFGSTGVGPRIGESSPKDSYSRR
jgi:hypothetical protein